MIYLQNNYGSGNEGDPPNKPKTPAKPDENPDPTKRLPGTNEPEKIDPTRIEEPPKVDPTRIDNPEPKPDHFGKNIVGEDDIF
jgi:hypothetical protein